MFKIIYSFIQYQLKELKDINGEPIFKLIDRWKRQSHDYSKTRETPFPSAYVEIIEMEDIEEFQEKLISATYTINIHVCVERYKGTELRDEQQNESLDIWTIIDKVGTLHLASMEDQTKLFLDELYFPHSGQTVDSIVYDYEPYLVGPLHLRGMKDISGQNDDLDEYLLTFRTRVTDSYNMDKWITLTGVTYQLSAVTYKIQ